MPMQSVPFQKNAEMLKNLHCKISNEENTNLKLIPYEIHAVSRAGTMRNIILQHNIFLKNMVMVPIVNIQGKDAEKVKKTITLSISQDGNPQDKQQKENIYSSLTKV